MLHIKRRPGQGVVIGRDDPVKLRVVALNIGSVALEEWRHRVYTPLRFVQPFDSTFDFHCDGERVVVHVGRVREGEIKLSFEAPRVLLIRSEEIDSQTV